MIVLFYLDMIFCPFLHASIQLPLDVCQVYWPILNFQVSDDISETIDETTLLEPGDLIRSKDGVETSSTDVSQPMKFQTTSNILEENALAPASSVS